MQKQTRRFVVLSSGALQAVLLLMCVWLWSVWMEGRLTNSLADRAANQSQQLVDQLASEIADCGPDTAEIGSKAWERIDERVRIGSGDNGSFLAVLDTNSNRLTHHADLSRDIRDHVVVDAIDILQPPSADSMKWRLSFGNAGVVGRRVPGSTLAVVCYQPRHIFVAEAKRMLGPLQQLGLLAAMLIAISSGVMLSSVSKRYEDKINNVNEELDALVAIRLEEFTRTRDAIIYGLARLAESRDTDTGEHLDRIQYYSCLLAERMAKQKSFINHEYIQKLRLASTLHDIGKVGIPDEILLKPGRLAEKERKIMQQHAVIGSRCLREIRDRLENDGFLAMAYNIAIGHHEHWDGNGYPYGVSGVEIPFEARVVAIADVYDALRSQRVYKDSMSHEQASLIIRQGSGTQFDPELVEVFERCSEEFKAQSQHASQEPEICLLERIRECLHESSDVGDVEAGLKFLQDAETGAKELEAIPS